MSLLLLLGLEWGPKAENQISGVCAQDIYPYPQFPPWHSPLLAAGPASSGTRGWNTQSAFSPSLPLLQSQRHIELLRVARSSVPGQPHSGLDRLLWTALRTRWPRVASFLWALVLWVLNDWLCNYTLECITYSRNGDCMWRTKPNFLNYGVSFRKQYKAIALP